MNILTRGGKIRKLHKGVQGCTLLSRIEFFIPHKSRPTEITVIADGRLLMRNRRGRNLDRQILYPLVGVDKVGVAAQFFDHGSVLRGIG